MTRLSRFVERVRAAWRTQLELQERYVERHALSGAETLAAHRALRWQGDRLVGWDLPTC